MKMEIKWAHGTKGISELIASIFSMLFGVIMIAIVLTVIRPTFSTAEDSSSISDIFQNMKIIDTAIKEVSSEARGSKRSIPITVSGGEYRINSTYDWLYVVYEPKGTISISGTKDNINIEPGLEFADYFNWYIEGSTGTPTWKNTSGQWSVSSLKYLGSNGSSCMNITPRPIENFAFAGKINNVSGPAGGQIFVIPRQLESLQGFWPFDVGSGNESYDYSGNGHTGNLTDMDIVGSDTSGWQPHDSCKAGVSCLRFDGLNDYVDTGYTTTLGTDDEISIEMWVRTTIKSGIQAPVGFGSTTANWNRIQFDLDTNGNLRFYVRDDNGNTNSYRDVSTDLSNGEWHHIIGTWNGATNTASLYINGVLKGFDSTNTLGAITIVHPLTIGALDDNGNKVNFFTGDIDEVKVWNVALSPEEVAAEYEMSSKKLYASGSQSVAAKSYASLVLSNPAGQTQFDDVKISRGKTEISFIISYSKVNMTGELRLRKGEHHIQIEHMGPDEFSNRPIINVVAS